MWCNTIVLCQYIDVSGHRQGRGGDGMAADPTTEVEHQAAGEALLEKHRGDDDGADHWITGGYCRQDRNLQA